MFVRFSKNPGTKNNPGSNVSVSEAWVGFFDPMFEPKVTGMALVQGRQRVCSLPGVADRRTDQDSGDLPSIWVGTDKITP